jgi:hypothetical protein
LGIGEIEIDGQKYIYIIREYFERMRLLSGEILPDDVKEAYLKCPTAE